MHPWRVLAYVLTAGGAATLQPAGSRSPWLTLTAPAFGKPRVTAAREISCLACGAAPPKPVCLHSADAVRRPSASEPRLSSADAPVRLGLDRRGHLRPAPLVGSLLVVGALVAGAAPAFAAGASATAGSVVYDTMSVRTVAALVLACAAAGTWAENNTRLGSVVSGAMTTFALAMLLAGAGILPASQAHPVYQTVWTHLIPLGICQLMLSLDRRSIGAALQASTGMLSAFLLASVGTVAGSLAAFKALAWTITEPWKYAAVFSATYVGGTINFLATADAVGLRDPTALATAFSADMLAMAVYFVALFYIGGRFNRGKARAVSAAGAQGAGGGVGGPDPAAQTALVSQSQDGIPVEGFVASQAVAAGITCLAFACASRISAFDAGVPIVTVLALVVSLALPDHVRKSWGASLDLVGTLFIQLFFAAIGATTDIKALVASAALWPLLGMVMLILAVQGGVLELVGRRVLGLDLRDLLLASNAAVGGCVAPVLTG